MGKIFFKYVLLIVIIATLATTGLSCQQLTEVKKRVFKIKKKEIKLEELKAANVKEIASPKAAASPQLKTSSSQEQKQILKLTKNYLEISFLNLNTWKGERGISRLASLFSSEAQSRAKGEDLAGLGLGEKALEKLDSIEKAQATITRLYISFDSEDNGEGVKPVAALVEFNLKAVFKQKDRRKADLTAKGNLSLDKTSGQWKIDSYQVNQSIKSR